MMRVASARALCIAALALLAACKTAPAAPDPDGMLLTVSLGDGYNKSLVTGMEVVFDAAPGNNSLNLSPRETEQFSSRGITYEVSRRSVDRDDDPEYVVRFMQTPFAQADKFEFFFTAAAGVTPELTVRVNLLSSRGILASAVATQLPDGVPLRSGPKIRSQLIVSFPCIQGSTCLTSAQENRSPIFAEIGTLQIRQERTLSLRVDAYDPDGDPLTYSAVLANVDGATFDADPAQRRFQWTPDASKVRPEPYDVRFEVSDGRGGSASVLARIVVQADNSAPVWSPVAQRVAVEGQKLSVQLDVEDPDGDPLTITLDTSGLPDSHDAEYNEANRIFTWTPTSADGQEEAWTVVLEANDGKGGRGTLRFEVVVVDVNVAPVILIPAELQVRAGQLASLTVEAHDPDDNANVSVAANFEGLPPGNDANFDPGTKQFTWTPAASAVRAEPWIVRFTATDDKGASHVARLGLIVSNSNSAPVFNPLVGSIRAKAGLPYMLMVSATDAEDGSPTITFDPSRLPPDHGAQFSGGTFTWMPKLEDARGNPYGVRFIATDSGGLSAVLDVLIFVEVGLARPAPPVVAGTTPDSPANQNAPVVFGTAGMGETVTVYASPDCAEGTNVGTGTTNEIGEFQISVSVADNSTTTFTAKATNVAGPSACSTTSATFVEDSAPPGPPSGLATTPASPANQNSPTLTGMAEAGATVSVFADASCAGTPIGTEMVAGDGSFSHQFGVADDTVTALSANATDAAGNTSGCASSIQYVEDSQAPMRPTDLGFTPTSPANQNNAALTGTTDPNATVSVFMNATCSDQPAATVVADGAGVFRHPFSVQDDTTTEWSVVITDAAGNAAACSGVVAYVEDSVAPDVGGALVRDGPGADASAQASNNTVVANWTGFTDLNGVVGYDHNVSETPTCDGNVRAFTDVGNVTTVTVTGLALTNGVTYYNCVRARDAAGNVSAPVVSNGITIDTSIPEPPVLANIGSPQNRNDITLVGMAPESGLSVKIYGDASCTEPPITTVVSTDGGEFSAMVSVADDSTNSFSAVVLSAAMVPSPCSAAITYIEDSTAPNAAAATVGDGLSGDATYLNGATSSQANWSGFTDANGVVGYEHNVSTTTECLGDAGTAGAAGSGSSHTLTGLTLTNASTYINCIRALDAAGNMSAWVPSNGYVLDSVAPSVSGASVNDGTSSDIDYQTTRTSFSANWSGFSDADSGIVGYEYNISTAATCTGNAYGTQDLGDVGTTTTSVTLSNSTKYFSCVRAVDAAGNRSDWVASDGVTTDTTAPSFGGLITVTAVSSSSVTLSWSNASDNVTAASQMIYDVCATPTRIEDGGCDPFVATQTTAPGAGTLEVTGLNGNRRYYFKVRATDQAGHMTTNPTMVTEKTWSNRAHVEVTAGSQHICALLSDGTVWCWGNNFRGQVGITPIGTQTAHLSLTNVRSIAAGGEHTCAVTAGGLVYCWGRNDYGAIGTGSDTPSEVRTPTQVPGLTTVVKVVAGGNHTCALKGNGTVHCWGRNNTGQVGSGSGLAEHTSPVQVLPLSGEKNAVDISAGSGHTCAVLGDGLVKCWGLNLDGQVGDNTGTQRNTPVTVYDSSGTSPLEAISISAGGFHTCAIDLDRSVYCWGQNQEGQLCNGTNTLSRYAIPSQLGKAREVAAGEEHTCAISTSDGRIRCCGKNGTGQLGNNSTSNESTPQQVSGIGASRRVAAGYDSSCGITDSGTLYCWGDKGIGTNDDADQITFTLGRVGAIKVVAGDDETLALMADGTVQRWGGTSSRRLPEPFPGLADVIDIGAGGNLSGCAVISNGEVQCWGSSFTGNSSIGTVANAANAISVTVGFNHACAVLGDGNGRCWGENASGQLGDGSTTASPMTAVQVTTRFLDISAGSFFTCGTRMTTTPLRRVYCWGQNTSGQLGLGTTSTREETEMLLDTTQTAFKSVAAGGDHACFVQPNATMSCWGDNDYGQLGDASEIQRLSPVSVSGVSSAVDIGAGDGHTCYTRYNGVVRCWGHNHHGQVGDGSIDNASSFKAVSGVGNVIGKPAPGRAHTCARRADGTVYCWGFNNVGQIGDGTSTERRTAVFVKYFP